MAGGVQLELGGTGSQGQPWQSLRPWWDSATWLPAVSSLRLLPEPPAKPEGTGSDRGEEISWAVSRGAGLGHWGLCHHLGPQTAPGGPFGEDVAGQEVQNLGGREQGGHPSLQEPGNPSPQPESCLEEECNVNKPPFTALLPCSVCSAAATGLTEPWLSLGQPCASHDGVSLREWGTVFPKVPWARCQGCGAAVKSCRVILGRAKSIPLCARQWTRATTSSLGGCGLAGVPQELHSFWVSFEGLCGAGGRVTVWAAFLPAVSPGGERQEQGHGPQPALPCLKRGARYQKLLPVPGPSRALTEPQCASTRRSWGALLGLGVSQSSPGAARSALGSPLASGVWVPSVTVTGRG